MADIYLHHRKDKRLYASVYRLDTVIFSFLSFGNLSNNDGDANEDSKKAIGLGWHNNNSARASRFFVHFCAVLTGLLISGFMEDAADGNTTRQTHEKINNLWQTRRVLIRAMKFETAWILFLGEVFAAVAVLIVKRIQKVWKRFEPGSHLIGRWNLIVQVSVVLNSTVVVDSDWSFDNLCGSRLQNQSE